MSEISTIKFEFHESEDSCPICLAITEDETFVCLDLCLFVEDYAQHCGAFISSWFGMRGCPSNWQQIYYENNFDFTEEIVALEDDFTPPVTF